MSSNVYILGGSQTDFSRNWGREGLEVYDMFAEALTDGIRDAKIEPAQIEVGHVGNFVADLFAGQGLIGGFFGQVFPELGMLPTSRHEAACASGSMAILGAMRDIEAGYYDIACVVGIELMRNVSGKTGAEYLGAATWQGHEALSCNFPWPFMFDLITQEYDRRYGIRDDHLTQIAEINFANAKLNENAQTRVGSSPKVVSVVMKHSTRIEGRVRKLDCGQITDGAACIILASERFARQHAEKRGLKLQDIPRIKGWGHCSAPISLETKLARSRGDDLIFPHAAKTMSDALNRAGFGAADEVDGLETHDCFTVTEYMAIDHSALTKPGESWKAVESGRIAIGGEFPINSSGGLIGLGHPVGATGVRMALDCAKQVSGRAGAYQIPDARNLLTFNMGGSTTTCASLVVGVGT